MATVNARAIPSGVGETILQAFGTGPLGNVAASAAGGVVTFPAGYKIAFAVGGGKGRISELVSGVAVPASDGDEVFARIVDDEIVGIEAAADTPAGNQRLGVATGVPVDTFTEDARAGGLS